MAEYILDEKRNTLNILEVPAGLAVIILTATILATSSSELNSLHTGLVTTLRKWHLKSNSPLHITNRH